MRLTRPIAGLVVAGLTLAGCAGQGVPHITIPTTSAPGVTPAAVSTAVPADITIAKISAHSTLIPLGLNADGSPQVPDVHTPLQAGFYSRGGVKPGQAGPPLVVYGHINGAGQQGLFARLGELKLGDITTVKLTDSKVLTFRVISTESDPKTAFPGKRVFGSQDHPTLRLVTCGGSFDAVARSYRSNIVVFLDGV